MLLLIAVGCTTGTDDAEQSGTSAPEKTAAGPPAYGDIIVQGSIGDASNLIPMLSSDSSSQDIAGLCYNGLVKYDKDLNLIGDLAESWDVSDDKLTITFHLRHGVKWQDGTEFTAEDVMFGYQTIISPNTPTAYSGDFLEVKKAEVVDPHTFRVTYKEAFAPGLASWSNLVVVPKHLLEGTDITTSPLIRQTMGTGPYRLKEWRTGEKIVLTSNHEYFDGRPFIDGVIYRIIPDLATMFLELKAGNIDFMGLTPLQYLRQTDTGAFRKNFRKYKYLSFSYTYLGYNLLNPKFQDRRVRQAISYAIDKNEILEGVLFGLGEIATGPYKPGTWAFNSQVKPYPYDPARARQLLREAGWVDTDRDGILDKDGAPFEFTVITNQGNSQRTRTAEIIQRRLSEIGISMKIRTLEWATFINEYIDKKKFEATLLGWTISPDPDQYDIWHSSKTNFKELNFISYKNAEVDELLLQGRHTFDQEKRKQLYSRFQEILAEEQPYTFLYVPYALPVIHKRFRGIKPAAAGISYNFPKWYVPKAEHKYTIQP
ncbi:MAG TPA: peptide-binding protein [Thermodesulfobacteriota bacterium]|nr:peptide-binding protein [Deltaproteobacteria bacterium]HNR12848.1 peptide-binding protein [Thermodesulfobacteriota bacterium]HNU72180.1 peptide-binding protein [Thermodesulfobacteriota bacterium]HOC38855.1 peptide-binding protein [Thermodesulfobacteriota bacterium]